MLFWGAKVCRSGVVTKVFAIYHRKKKNKKPEETTTSNVFAFVFYCCFYLVPSWTSCTVAANQTEAMAARDSREKVANR